MVTRREREAEARFSDGVEKANEEGPQAVTHHGTERAMVRSVEDDRDLGAPRLEFTAYLLGGPKVDDFQVERDQDTGREIDL